MVLVSLNRFSFGWSTLHITNGPNIDGHHRSIYVYLGCISIQVCASVIEKACTKIKFLEVGKITAHLFGILQEVRIYKYSKSIVITSAAAAAASASITGIHYRQTKWLRCYPTNAFSLLMFGFIWFLFQS